MRLDPTTASVQDTKDELDRLEREYATAQDLRNRAIKSGDNPSYTRALTQQQTARAKRIAKLRSDVKRLKYNA